MNNHTKNALFLLVATGWFPHALAQPAPDSSLGTSIEQKSPESEYQMARDLLKGNGGDEAAKKGFQMMLNAANQGHLPAIAGVAYLYSVGKGTPKDNAATAKWYRLAAEKEHAISRYNLGKLLVAAEIPLPEGTADRKTQRDEGVEWIRKAADQGLDHAQATYGIILLRGDLEIKSDPAAAAEYLKLAAEAGNLEAMNALGIMHRTGNGVTRDRSASEQLLRRAAMAGHVKAQANLGNFLDPSSKNPDKRIEALAWLFIAEEANDSLAKNILTIKLQATSPDDVAAGKKKANEIQLKISEAKK